MDQPGGGHPNPNITVTMKRFVQMLCLASLLAATTVISAGEKSDAVDLLKQGRVFQSECRTNEALWAYRQAAKVGNVEAAFAAGSMLFRMGYERSNREQILQLTEGLEYLFVAATNRLPTACAMLAQASENGIGIETNLIGAYVWMHIAAQGDNAFRDDLDHLVIKLEPDEIFQAQKLTQDYLSGHWPTRLVRAVDQGDSRLVVQGVSFGDRGALVILNGNTLAQGESVDVVPRASSDHKSSERLFVSCREIGSDYLLVAVSGEPNLKLLPLERQ